MDNFIVLYICCISIYLFAVFVEANRISLDHKFKGGIPVALCFIVFVVTFGLNLYAFLPEISWGEYIWRILTAFFYSIVFGLIYGLFACLHYVIYGSLCKRSVSTWIIVVLKVIPGGIFFFIVLVPTMFFIGWNRLILTSFYLLKWEIIAISILLSIMDGVAFIFVAQRARPIVKPYLWKSVLVLLILSAASTSIVTGIMLYGTVIHHATSLSAMYFPDCKVRLQNEWHFGESYYELVEREGRYPANMDEFIEVTTPNLNLLICPYSEGDSISFEYFEPENLKDDLDFFIILYEKPNNHVFRAGQENSRTIIHSTGFVVDQLPESEVYRLLLEQSTSPEGFIWEPSTGEVSPGWLRLKNMARIRGAIPGLLLLCILLSTINFSVWKYPDNEDIALPRFFK
jgi:hypothetical protein